MFEHFVVATVYIVLILYMLVFSIKSKVCRNEDSLLFLLFQNTDVILKNKPETWTIKIHTVQGSH